MRTFESMKNAVAIRLLARVELEDAIWQVVDFENKALSTEEINGLIEVDSTFKDVDTSGGHNSINYPDDLTIENIVTTNVQERLFEHFEK